ncbi:unnamed protein product [Lactuca saligna]|uniref:Disease resistance protein At4g27190-like leucine-rich repeats domain-containing protein n=1 Tax=Lactuca saligna TaxID=75948 RepID=A0AA35UTD6_LACSI|nr:unnamed protein product [Lactuca saligna]
MVFPLSVAQGLSNLRRLKISSCDSLMVVISGGDEQLQATGSDEIEQTEDSETEVGIHDDANIVFPRLIRISLSGLPKLKSFYSGDSTVKYPSLEFIKYTYQESYMKIMKNALVQEEETSYVSLASR